MMSNTKHINLPHLVDLALASPNIGEAINLKLLHSILHIFVKRLKLDECMVHFDEPWDTALKDVLLCASKKPRLSVTEQEDELQSSSTIFKITPKSNCPAAEMHKDVEVAQSTNESKATSHPLTTTASHEIVTKHEIDASGQDIGDIAKNAYGGVVVEDDDASMRLNEVLSDDTCSLELLDGANHREKLPHVVDSSENVGHSGEIEQHQPTVPHVASGKGEQAQDRNERVYSEEHTNLLQQQISDDRMNTQELRAKKKEQQSTNSKPNQENVMRVINEPVHSNNLQEKPVSSSAISENFENSANYQNTIKEDNSIFKSNLETPQLQLPINDSVLLKTMEKRLKTIEANIRTIQEIVDVTIAAGTTQPRDINGACISCKTPCKQKCNESDWIQKRGPCPSYRSRTPRQRMN